MPEEDGKPDFGGEYEVNTHREHIAAYVLIAGLGLEVVHGIVWFHGIETIATIVAVLMIVAGVWGEVFFGNKARIAGDKQLAQYEAQAAEANAKALEANLKLEEERSARLRFEAARSWRSITSEQHTEMAAALHGFAGQRFHIMTYRDDPECERFTYQVVMTLERAGWLQDGRFTEPMALDERLIKLSISDDDLIAPSYAFMDAMRGVGFDCATVGNPKMHQGVIEIRIGRKPERAAF